MDDQLATAGGALAAAQERRDAMSTHVRGGVDGLAESFRRELLEAGDLFEIELG